MIDRDKIFEEKNFLIDEKALAERSIGKISESSLTIKDVIKKTPPNVRNADCCRNCVNAVERDEHNVYCKRFGFIMGKYLVCNVFSGGKTVPKTILEKVVEERTKRY